MAPPPPPPTSGVGSPGGLGVKSKSQIASTSSLMREQDKADLELANLKLENLRLRDRISDLEEFQNDYHRAKTVQYARSLIAEVDKKQMSIDNLNSKVSQLAYENDVMLETHRDALAEMQKRIDVLLVAAYSDLEEERSKSLEIYLANENADVDAHVALRIAAKEITELKHQLDSGRIELEKQIRKELINELRLGKSDIIKELNLTDEEAALGLRVTNETGNKAPTGNVTLVFTDVQDSTSLWEEFPDAMERSLKLHNDLMRRTMKSYRGYEVKTEGDAFMVAFHTPLEAVQWCLQVQESLLVLDWPREMMKGKFSGMVYDKNKRLIFNGLRVRMGVHTGNPIANLDPSSRRVDYFGPMVNRSARISGAAHGGQVVLSLVVTEAIAKESEVLGFPVVKGLGEHAFKGLKRPERVSHILPPLLAGREFPAIKSATTAQLVHASYNQRTQDAKQEEAVKQPDLPTGELTLVFTDVENSTAIWEADPVAMKDALDLHNSIFREALPQFDGYEVKTEGDAFMLVFTDPEKAVQYCTHIQLELLNAQWPRDLLGLREARRQLLGDSHGFDHSQALRPLFAGLRVRIGCHTGTPILQPDPVTGRADYFGPVVNRAARVGGAAHGGQIIVSASTWAAIEDKHDAWEEGIVVESLGSHVLKGLRQPEILYQVLPEFVQKRTFPVPKTVTSTQEVRARHERPQLQISKNQVPPPEGDLALVIVHIPDAPALWEDVPTPMGIAVDLYHRLIVDCVKSFKGCIVKGKDTEVMIAFSLVKEATEFALKFQEDLMSLKWPTDLLSHEYASEEQDEAGNLIFYGLRAAIGISFGSPIAIDGPDGNLVYHGPVVSRAESIAGAAHGGQILLGQSVYRAISDRLSELGDPLVVLLGDHKFQGLKRSEPIVQMLHRQHMTRIFPAVHTITTAVQRQRELANSASGQVVQTSAAKPHGQVVMSLFRIQDSEELWFANASDMELGVRLVIPAVQEEAEKNEGFIILQRDTTFMIAFPTIVKACKFGLQLQRRLMGAPWPERLLRHPSAQLVYSEDGTLLHRGPRIAMAIHLGFPDLKISRESRFGLVATGPLATELARITSGAKGGQILLTETIFEAMPPRSVVRHEIGEYLTTKRGAHTFRGLRGPVVLFDLVAEDVSEREFLGINSVTSKIEETAQDIQGLKTELDDLKRQTRLTASRTGDLDGNSSLISAAIEILGLEYEISNQSHLYDYLQRMENQGGATSLLRTKDPIALMNEPLVDDPTPDMSDLRILGKRALTIPDQLTVIRQELALFDESILAFLDELRMPDSDQPKLNQIQLTARVIQLITQATHRLVVLEQVLPVLRRSINEIQDNKGIMSSFQSLQKAKRYTSSWTQTAKHQSIDTYRESMMAKIEEFKDSVRQIVGARGPQPERATESVGGRAKEHHRASRRDSRSSRLPSGVSRKSLESEDQLPPRPPSSPRQQQQQHRRSREGSHSSLPDSEPRSQPYSRSTTKTELGAKYLQSSAPATSTSPISPLVDHVSGEGTESVPGQESEPGDALDAKSSAADSGSTRLKFSIGSVPSSVPDQEPDSQPPPAPHTGLTINIVDAAEGQNKFLTVSHPTPRRKSIDHTNTEQIVSEGKRRKRRQRRGSAIGPREPHQALSGTHGGDPFEDSFSGAALLLKLDKAAAVRQLRTMASTEQMVALPGLISRVSSKKLIQSAPADEFSKETATTTEGDETADATPSAEPSPSIAREADEEDGEDTFVKADNASEEWEGDRIVPGTPDSNLSQAGDPIPDSFGTDARAHDPDPASDSVRSLAATRSRSALPRLSGGLDSDSQGGSFGIQERPYVPPFLESLLDDFPDAEPAATTDRQSSATRLDAERSSEYSDDYSYYSSGDEHDGKEGRDELAETFDLQELMGSALAEVEDMVREVKYQDSSSSDDGGFYSEDSGFTGDSGSGGEGGEVYDARKPREPRTRKSKGHRRPFVRGMLITKDQLTLKTFAARDYALRQEKAALAFARLATLHLIKHPAKESRDNEDEVNNARHRTLDFVHSRLRRRLTTMVERSIEIATEREQLRRDAIAAVDFLLPRTGHQGGGGEAGLGAVNSHVPSLSLAALFAAGDGHGDLDGQSAGISTRNWDPLRNLAESIHPGYDNGLSDDGGDGRDRYSSYTRSPSPGDPSGAGYSRLPHLVDPHTNHGYHRRATIEVNKSFDPDESFGLQTVSYQTKGGHVGTAPVSVLDGAGLKGDATSRYQTDKRIHNEMRGNALSSRPKPHDPGPRPSTRERLENLGGEDVHRAIRQGARSAFGMRSGPGNGAAPQPSRPKGPRSRSARPLDARPPAPRRVRAPTATGGSSLSHVLDKGRRPLYSVPTRPSHRQVQEGIMQNVMELERYDKPVADDHIKKVVDGGDDEGHRPLASERQQSASKVVTFQE